MKTSLIAPIGTSAPVITEMVLYLHGLEGADLTDVVVLETKDEYVKAHAKLAKTAINSRYPRMRVHIHTLPFSDVRSTEDTIEFMHRVAKIIKEERLKYKCERVYLSIAGGRKDICTSLSIMGQLIGVDGVFHVIHPSVTSFNIQLERIKDKILELYHIPAEQRLDYYLKYKDAFDSVMFPETRELNYIRIPCIPYPQDYLGKVVKILLSEFTLLENKEIPLEELKRLERAGIIKILKDRIVPTDFGSIIGNIWK